MKVLLWLLSLATVVPVAAMVWSGAWPEWHQLAVIVVYAATAATIARRQPQWGFVCAMIAGGYAEAALDSDPRVVMPAVPAALWLAFAVHRPRVGGPAALAALLLALAGDVGWSVAMVSAVAALASLGLRRAVWMASLLAIPVVATGWNAVDPIPLEWLRIAANCLVVLAPLWCWLYQEHLHRREQHANRGLHQLD